MWSTGPAIVTEMDSTTLILPGHAGTVDASATSSSARPPDRSEGTRSWPRIVETNPTPFGRVDVDPVTLDIIENALRNARYEMDAVLFRTAMSPGIREQHDEFPLIADRRARWWSASSARSSRFLAGYDGTIEEGDIFLTSDPYSCGGAISHANDWLVLLPIFHDGRLVGWAAMFGHMTDVGGKVPGSLPTDATLDLRGRHPRPADQDLPQGRAEHRDARTDPQQVPDAALEPSDFNAIVAACRTAARRGDEICDRFGVDDLHLRDGSMLERNGAR